jgi:uncharacterized protein YeaO (DUF488 family)
MAIRVIRLGTPRKSGEGPRLGTGCRPARGVHKADYSAETTAMCGSPSWLSNQRFSVGCYCQDESRCHRTLLRDLLVEVGAEVE